ncbi:MAG: phycobiliprotein lyase [Synechococcus sp.]
MNAMEFFELSVGRWRSNRITHHLAFRRAETGELEVELATLSASDPRVIELCNQHQFDPAAAMGGCFVKWGGKMAWDKEDADDHEGATVMVLVATDDSGRKGRLLREQGYAEKMPVAGHFHMDEEDGLILTTDYETMSASERFSFASNDLRLRTSTVKRFGGFSTSSLCVETRI